MSFALLLLLPSFFGAGYLLGWRLGELAALQKEPVKRAWEDGFRRGWWKSLMRDAPATDAPKGDVQ